MSHTQQRQGEFFMFGEAILWSLFPVITVLSYNTLSPLISLFLSSLFALGFFAIIMTKKKLWHEIHNRNSYKNVLFTTFFLGISYYLLVFIGLQYTSPGNASIIGLTQVFFSFLLFHVFRKEHIPKSHIFGGLLMVLGALIVLASNFNSFHLGDTLILLANMIAPLGNFFAQKARKQIASETLMFERTLLSTVFFFLLALVLRTPFTLLGIQDSLLFLLINGVLLLGFSKILWLEAIHRISVTKANALGSIEPLLTLFFAWMLLQQHPTSWQILSFIPIFFGVLLLGKKKAEPLAAESN